METVQVNYLGKSKHSFAVNVKGVEYKFKPDKMSSLDMPADHAAALVASAPHVWVIDNPFGVSAAEGTAALEAVASAGRLVSDIDIGTSGYDPDAIEPDAPGRTFVGEPMSVDEVLHIAGAGSKSRRRKDNPYESD